MAAICIWSMDWAAILSVSVLVFESNHSYVFNIVGSDFEAVAIIDANTLNTFIPSTEFSHRKQSLTDVELRARNKACRAFYKIGSSLPVVIAIIAKKVAELIINTCLIQDPKGQYNTWGLDTLRRKR